MATADVSSAPRSGSRARKSTERAARPAKASASRAKAAKSPAKAAPKATGGRRGMTVPLVNVRVPMLRAQIPGGDMARQQTMWAAQTVRSYLPPVERLLYYGGLGTAAVVGALEWPVAVAAGAGVWVATHTRRQANRVTPE